MNQPEVKTFRAATMQEALALVRKELGSEAVILSSRDLPQPKLLRWMRNKEAVEVTAGNGINVREPAATARNGTVATGGASTIVAERPAEPGSGFTNPIPVGLDLRSSWANSLSRNVGQDLTAPATNRLSSVMPSPGTASDGIARQLTSIQNMVERMTRTGATSKTDDVPTELFQIYTRMIDSEIDETLVRELVCRLKKDGNAEQLGDVAWTRAKLRSYVEAELRCGGPIAVTPGTRRVVALVGPTGVGKTTTIAKLAANLRLRDGVKMGLVTVDTYRVAAVEQLRTYADIIDLPMKVVTSPREMRRAIDELSGMDLVLIDTAGRSPRDELKIQELKSFLAEAQVNEVHLVLSLVSSARSLAATAGQFASVGTTSVVFTKLDEAVEMGVLLSAARQIPLPISYLTTGQDVPDDIESAEGSRIARLVLGEDRLR
ncbi:MAG: flagellar biosynthesis protein FlhF [Planctomycetales bacterium]|nr:flagellar biosynthesis protein FlhF [Planctomycetales bacterium]